jgi:hypothetical protein
MTSIVYDELARMMSLMKETDPRGLEYTQLMRNFEVLAAQTDMYDEVVDLMKAADGPHEIVEIRKPEVCASDGHEVCVTDGQHESEIPTQSTAIPTPATEATRAPAEAAPSDTGANIVQPEGAGPETHPEYKLEEVRAALVKSRRNGVNVTELLHEFGVDNFSSFPAGRYWELMDRLEGKV